MICEEVKINLHDYVDELLDDSTKRELEQHIRNCDLCFKEYQKMTLFFDKLKQLPAIINPPQEIIEKVKNELLKQLSPSSAHSQTSPLKTSRKIIKEKEKQKRKLLKESPAVKKSNITRRIYSRPYAPGSSIEIRKILLIILPLVIVAFGYYLYDLRKYNYPWSVVSVKGNPIVNGKPGESDKWNQGEILITDKTSQASVRIPKVGTINVSENSFLSLDKAKDGANLITLKNGKVSVVNEESMPDFTISVTDFDILDRGGKFDLEYLTSAGAKLEVDFAFVEITHEGNSYLVDENHTCVLRKGFRPGLPVHLKASDSLRAAIELFDFKEGGEEAVEKIIKFAKEEDMLTLLALIPFVPQLQRQIIFQEISNRFPPPESVTRAGIIRLDKDMLYRWWEEIEWQL
jgi:hypothetical protein